MQHLRKYLCTVLVLLLIESWDNYAYSQTAISSYTVSVVNPPNSTYSATAPSDASNDINSGQTYDVSYGRGDDYNLVSYTIAGRTYANSLEPDTLVLRRTDGGRFVNIWYTLIDIDVPLLFGTTELIMDGQEVEDADALYQTGSLISGYDNILVNVDNQASGSIQAQIERVDAIWRTGIVTCEPDSAVFPVIERGGNDSIKIAAITALDNNGNPSAYSSMVDIVDSDWPQSGIYYDDYLILRRQTVGENPLPLLNTGVIAGQPGQVIQGVAVSFTELGISAGQIIYGYSLFAYDTNDTDHDLTDISTFPTTTSAAASGLDLVAGVSAAVSADDCLTPAIGPGGYKAALSTWLKANETADVTTSTEGSNITDWQDHWIGNHDFTTSVTSPIYRSSTSNINFNQTADFTSTDRGLTTSNNSDFNNNGSSYENKGISLVFRTDSDVTTRQVLYEQGDDNRGINIYIRNGSLFTHAWNRTSDGTGAPWNTGDNTSSISITGDTEYVLTFELEGNSSISGSFRAYLNGQIIGTVPNIGLLFSHTGDINLGRSGAAQRYDDGSNSNANSFRGEIPEFIYCNEPGSFTASTRNKIESYLALKYGVTLNQGTPINYVNSSGEIIFNTTLNASLGGYLEYNNDIAGIGRDDNSEFEQQKSRSENNGSVITIDNGANFNANDTWLIWGNDGGNADDLSQASDVPSIINNRVDRVWRVSENGNVGTVDISFDLNEVTFSGSPTSSDYSLLIAANNSAGNFSNAQIITGGVVNGSTLTFFDVDLDDAEYFTLGTGYIDCGPGGVSTNLALWLKADLGPNSTSGEVTSWEDLASGNNATGSSGTVPSYLSNSINFNPALDFDGVDNVLTSADGFYTHAYYLVLTPDDTYTSATTRQVPLGWDDSSVTTTSSIGGFYLGGIFSGSDDVLGHLVGNGANSYAQLRVDNTKTIPANIPQLFETRENAGATASGIFQNGIQVDNATSGSGYLAVSNEEYAIGRFETPNDFSFTNFFDGKIAEIISFSSRPTDAEKNRIQSYLAIKYGITIDQTSPQDYVNSAGTTVWNATTNSGYANDIAGIGRDDDSCLSQKQSKSSNSGSIVTIGNEGIFTSNVTNPNSFDSDNTFLIWGNDGDNPAQANANTVDVPGTVTERMETIWRVDKTGTIENNSISFDLSGLGYSSSATDFQLIISSSPTMASGSTITGGTFNGNVLTFNNIEFSDGDYFTLGTARETCGPGGVTTDLALWLKANEGTNTTTDDSNISSWADQSVNNRNGTELDLGGVNPVEPTYQTSEINFNPAIQFSDPNSTNASYIETTNGNNVSGDFTIITVFESGQLGGDTGDFENAPVLLGAGTSGTDLDYGLGIAEGRIHLNAANNDDLTVRSTAGTTYIDFEPYIATATRVRSTGALALYINSASNATGTGSTSTFSNPSGFGIGNNPSPTVGSQFAGRIAESIVFSDDLTTAERQRVESYLALKYGITRGGSSAYLASDGGTIWSYTSDASYNSDIAGIGRDDNSCLSQLKSKSENNDAIVTMEVASFNTDDSFLIWANDNAPMEDPDNREYNSSQVNSRLNREWHVQETGTIGNVTLTFDVSDISGPSGAGSNNLNLLRLMVDGDGDFSSGVTLYSPSSINSSEKTVSFTVNFSTGQYFTLGSEEIGALPIELLAFNAAFNSELNSVMIQWKTINEESNTMFEVQRSNDGQAFSTLHVMPGKELPSEVAYRHIDDNPVEGRSYYRLKTTDRSNNDSFSRIVAVDVASGNHENGAIYPNPVRRGSKAQIRLISHEFNDQIRIEVISPDGVVLYTEDKRLNQMNANLEIPTDKLRTGINLVRVKCSQVTKTYRLLIRD
jgi:hypothetical protein